MENNFLFTIEQVVVDLDVNSKWESFAVISAYAAQLKLVDNADVLRNGFEERENMISTGLEGGFAVPHAKVLGLKGAGLMVVKFKKGLEWGAFDNQPVRVAFYLLIPADSVDNHLKMLSEISIKLMDEAFKAQILATDDQATIFNLVNEVFNHQPVTKVETPKVEEVPKAHRYIVGITACPAGIAHTYMAAEALKKECLKRGYDIKIEKQGAGGTEDQLTAQDIARADGIVFAVDVEPKGMERFENTTYYKTSVADPLHRVGLIIDQVEKQFDQPKKAGVPIASETTTPVGDAVQFKNAFTKQCYFFLHRDLVNWKTSLLTGISYMVPVIVASGMFGAIMTLLKQIPAYHNLLTWIGNDSARQDEYWYAYWPTLLGSNLLNWIMAPILAAYMSYSLADKPGLAPGLAAGMCGIITNSGFIGGMIGGLIAGYIMRWMKKYVKVKKSLQGFVNFWLYPVLGTIIIGVIMILGIGRPLELLTKAIVSGLQMLRGGSSFVLGAIIGLAVAFDLGGPVNKAAYAFAIACMDPKINFLIPYATFAAIKMVPCFTTSLATALRPKYFNDIDNDMGKTTWILGLAGITEGNIPVALNDPLRVIPSYMIGSAVCGGLFAMTNVGLNVPGAGIISVFVLDTAHSTFNLWESALLWIGTALIGTIVSTAILLMLKGLKFYKNMHSISWFEAFGNSFTKSGRAFNAKITQQFYDGEILRYQNLMQATDVKPRTTRKYEKRITTIQRRVARYNVKERV